LVDYLIKTTYNENDVLELWYWNDEEGKIVRKLKDDDHLPYLITDKESYDSLKDKSKVCKVEEIVKYDATKHKEVNLLKVSVKNPTDIFDSKKKTGLRTLLNNSWEDNIKYDICYITDTDRHYCLPDGVAKRSETAVKPNELKDFLLKHFYNSVTYKIFKMKAKFLDIEVMGGYLDSSRVEKPVICCSIADEERRIVYANREFSDSSLISLTKNLHTSYLSTKGERISYDIVMCSNEYELLLSIFDELKDEIVLYTFNGDEFDLPYLNNRARILGFERSEIPIIVSFDGYNKICSIKNGLHIDILKTFKTGLLSYSYPVSRYPSLDDVSFAIIGEKKLKLPNFDRVSKELCDYCMNDSLLLFKIVSMEDWKFQKLLIMLSRLYNVSLEDLTRTSLSKLNYKLFQYAHRITNYLIPNRKYIMELNSNLNVPAGKSGSYKGGEVYISKPGIYFDVDVFDYASEYPGVIDAENLSYETINCPHEECRDNIVPEHNFHICRKEKGIVSALLGAIRDLRIQFKGRDPIISGALKICVLSGYGMFGMSGHELEIPAIASATTYFGRRNLSLGRSVAEAMGYNVLYGDTDSVFLPRLSDEERKKFIKELREKSKIEIEYDKTYKYLIISKKKNYLGCSYDGRIDVKGMVGKKRHQCLFLKKVFNEILEILRKIDKAEDLEKVKKEIRGIISEAVKKLKERRVELSELAFRVELSKSLDSSGQPYDVARLYLASGKRINTGDVVEFVLTCGAYSAKPLFLTNMSEIDIPSYIQRLEGMLKQILEPLDMDIRGILYGENASLEEFTGEETSDMNLDVKFREGIEKWFEE